MSSKVLANTLINASEHDSRRALLNELRDPPEYVIDRIAGLEGPCLDSGRRLNAIERWRRAIDELIYRA